MGKSHDLTCYKASSEILNFNKLSYWKYKIQKIKYRDVVLYVCCTLKQRGIMCGNSNLDCVGSLYYEKYFESFWHHLQKWPCKLTWNVIVSSSIK